MSTPILTKQQQKHSLSAKKSQVKGLRNVLAQPQDNFWPVVKMEKCRVLEELLNKLIPAIKRPCHSIPWLQLRHMEKEERARVRKEATLKEETAFDSEKVNSVILGINAITRALEKDNACCVIMDANIEPPLLVRHVIHMAENSKVPVLLLPKLKTITLNTIGFASAACALKNIVKESQVNHFHPLYRVICDIFKEIPVPKDRLQLFERVHSSEESGSCDSNDENDEIESQITPPKPVELKVSTDVYMYRSSRKERAFVPPTASESASNELPVAQKTDTNDFISLNTNDDDDDKYFTHVKQQSRYITIGDEKKQSKKRKHESKTTENVTYLPLKVKRIRGNPNRVKATKVSKLKQKK